MRFARVALFGVVAVVGCGGGDMPPDGACESPYARCSGTDLVLCESELERTITGGCGGGADLSNLDLSQGALAGGDFSDAVLDGADLTDADLTGANLEGTATGNLVGCSGATVHSDYECVARGDDAARFALIGPSLNLDGVDLSGTTIDGASLNSASFVDATLDGISLTNVNLQSANLTGASLTMAAIVESNLRDVRLAGADLSNAVLTGTFTGAVVSCPATLPSLSYQCVTPVQPVSRFSIVGPEVDLTNTHFDGVDLSAQDLDGTLLDGVSFVRTNLDGASLREASGTGVRFDEAVMSFADLMGAAFPAASFRDAVVDRSQLGLANLAGATFEGADLTNASFVGTDVSNADFLFANVALVSFTNDVTPATLTGARLRAVEGCPTSLPVLFGCLALPNVVGFNAIVGPGVNLAEANLSGASLASWSLVGANLSSANLQGSSLSLTNLSMANLTGATGTPLFPEAAIYSDTTCPNGTNSNAASSTCVGQGF